MYSNRESEILTPESVKFNTKLSLTINYQTNQEKNKPCPHADDWKVCYGPDVCYSVLRLLKMTVSNSYTCHCPTSDPKQYSASMQGGEGMVAVVQGLRDAGLAVTLVNRTYLQNAMKRDARRRVTATQSSAERETNTERVTQNNSTQICHRYVTNYQELIYGNESLPNAAMKQLPEFPLQRAEPSRTEGNFVVGPAVDKTSPSPTMVTQVLNGVPVRPHNRAAANYQVGGAVVENTSRSPLPPTQTFNGVPSGPCNRGSTFSASSSSPRQSDAFIHSLRRYPLAGRSVSSELVQRLLNYTETKHFSRKDSVSMRSLRNRSLQRARESKDSRVLRDSKEYRDSRESRTKRVKEAREYVRDSKVIVAKKLLEFRRIRSHKDSRRDRVYNVARVVSEARGIRESDEEKINSDSDVLTDPAESQELRQYLREVKIKFSKCKNPMSYREIRKIREIISRALKNKRESRRYSTGRIICKDSKESIELREPRKFRFEKKYSKEGYKRTCKPLNLEYSIEPLEKRNSYDRKRTSRVNSLKMYKSKEDSYPIDSREEIRLKESKQSRNEEHYNYLVQNNYNKFDADKSKQAENSAERNQQKSRKRETNKNERYQRDNDSDDMNDSREVRESTDKKESKDSKEICNTRKSREHKRQSRKSRRLSNSRRTNEDIKSGQRRDSSKNRDGTDVKVHKFMQTYTRTSNEMLLEGTGEKRNGGSSLEDNRYRGQTSETYNYLKAYSARHAAGGAQEIRYLHDMTRCVRDAIQQILGAPIVCPTMQDRYMQHRREHHHDAEQASPEDGICIMQPSTSRDVSVSFRCRPPLGTRRTCLFRPPIPPCQLEEPDPKSLNQNIDTSSVHELAPLGTSSPKAEAETNKSTTSIQKDDMPESSSLVEEEENEEMEDVTVYSSISSDVTEFSGETSSEENDIESEKDIASQSTDESVESSESEEDFDTFSSESYKSFLVNIDDDESSASSQSEEEANTIVHQVGDNIYDHLNDIAVIADDSPEMVNKCSNIIRKLALDLKKLQGDKDFPVKAKAEVTKCIHRLPMWFPGEKEDEPKLIDEMADAILINLNINENTFRHPSYLEKKAKRLKTKNDKKKIFEWLHDIPTLTQDTQIEDNLTELAKIASQLAIELNNGEDWKINKEKAKDEIRTYLDTIPMWLPGSHLDQEKFKNQIIDNLISKLNVDQQDDAIPNEKTIKNNISEWVYNLPIPAKNLPDSESTIEEIVKQLASTAIHFQNRDDFEEQVSNKAKEVMDILPVKLPGSQDSQEILKNQLIDNLIEDLETDKLTLQGNIRDWVEELPVYDNDPRNEDKKNETARKLASKINNLIGSENFENMARKETRTIIDNIPIWLPDNTSDQTAYKDQLIDNLLNGLYEIKPENLEDVKEVEKHIQDWLKNTPVYTESIPKIEKQLKKIAKTLAKKIHNLKEHNNFDKKAKQKIKEQLDELPLEWPITEQNQKRLKRQLADNLLDSILYPDDSRNVACEKIEEFVRGWVQDAIEFTDDDPKSKAIKEEAVRDLTHTLKGLVDRTIYKEKAIDEIKKCIEALPVEMTRNTNDAEIFAKNLVNTLLDDIKSEVPSNYAIAEQIRDWFENVPAYTDENPESISKREEVVKGLTQKVKLLKGNQHFEKKMNEAIRNYIEDLPLELTGTEQSQENLKTLLADNLLKNILNVKGLQSPRQDKIEEQIRDCLKEAPINLVDNPKTNAEKEKFVKNLAQKLKRLKGRDDYQEKVNEEIRKGIDSLPMMNELLGTKQDQENFKKHLRENILDNILKVDTEYRSDDTVEEQIRSWLEAESAFAVDNPNIMSKKEEFVRDLVNKIEHLKGHKDFKNKVKEEIKKGIETIPSELKGTKQRQESVLNQLADTILLNIIREEESQSPIHNDVEEKIRDWLEEVPITSDVSPETNAAKEKVVKDLARKLDLLKEQDDYQERADEEIRKGIDALPMQLSGTKQGQEEVKKQLVKSLKDKINLKVESKKVPTDVDVEDQIRDWFEYEPVFANNKPDMADKKEEVVKNLAQKTKRLQRRKDFKKKMKQEIKKGLKKLPAELSGSQESQEKVMNQLANDLLQNILNVEETKSLDDGKVEEQIRDWLEVERAFTTENPKTKLLKEEMVKSLTKKIKRLKGRKDFKNKIKAEIKKGIEALPVDLIGTEQSQETLKNELTENLLENILNVDKSQSPLSDEMEEQVHDWLEEIPLISDDNLRANDDKERVVKNLARKLNKLKGLDNYQEKANEEILKAIDALPIKLSGTQQSQEKMKKQLAKSLLDNNNMKVGEMEIFADVDVEQQIRDWIETESVFTNENQEIADKKEEIVEDLTKKIDHLKGSTNFKNKVKAEIKKAIEAIPLELTGTKQSQDKAKNQLVDNLIERIVNEEKAQGPLPDEVEQQIRGWLKEAPIISNDNPKTNVKKEKVVKDLSRKLKRLKGRDDYRENAIKEIKKGVNALPLQLSGSKENQEKVKQRLTNRLLDNIHLKNEEKINPANVKVEEKIRNWFEAEPVFANGNPKTADKKRQIIRDVMKTIDRNKGRKDFKKNVTAEIKKGIEALPLELTGTKQSQERIKNQLVDNLLENIMNEEESQSLVPEETEERIRDWQEDASITSNENPKTKAKTEKVVNDLSRNLKQLKDRDDNKEKANKEIRKIIDALPMDQYGTKQDQEKVKKHLARNLVESIIDETQSPAGVDVEKKIRDWLEAEPSLADDSLENKARREKVVKNLSRTLKNLTGCNNYEKKAQDEINKQIENLTGDLSGSPKYSKNMKDQESPDLLEDVRNSIPDKRYEEKVREWIEEVPFLTNKKSKNDDKKEEIVKTISRKMKYLRSQDNFKDEAKEEIKKYIDTLPLDIPGTKRNQEMVKNNLVDSLIRNIINVDESGISSDNEFEEPVLNWIDSVSTDKKGILKHKKKRNTIAKNLASKLKYLKNAENFEDKAKKEISKVVDRYLQGSKQNQNQLKSELVDNLLGSLNINKKNRECMSSDESKSQTKKVDLIDQRVDKEIRDWFEFLPVYTDDKPSNDVQREKVIRELAVKLKLLKGCDDFHEKAEIEINKLVNNLPLELSGSDSYQEIIRIGLSNKLLENILDAIESNNVEEEKVKAFYRRGTSFFPKVYPEDEIVEEQILEWLDDVPVTDESPKIEAKKEEVAKNLADSLKRLKGRGDYEEKAREEIKKHMNDLPLELTGTKGNQEMVINRLADTLLDNLNESGKPDIFVQPETFLTSPNLEEIERQVRDWLEEVPVFTEENPKNEAEKEKIVKHLAMKLDKLIGCDDFNAKARKEIKIYIDTLPLEIIGTKRNQEMVKNELTDHLISNLFDINKNNNKDREDEYFYQPGKNKTTSVGSSGYTSFGKHAVYNEMGSPKNKKATEYENSKDSSIAKRHSSNKDFYKPSSLKDYSRRTTEQHRPSNKSASFVDQTYFNDTEDMSYKDETTSGRPRRSSDNKNNDFYRPNSESHTRRRSSSEKPEYFNEEATSSISPRRIPEEKEIFNNDNDETITDKVVEEQIVKWLKKVPVFRSDTKEDKTKKAETVKELASKLQNLIEKDYYKEQAKNEIKDHIDILPMFFPGSKQDQEISKNRIAETLLDMIQNEKLNMLKGVIMDWLDEIQILRDEDSSSKKVNNGKIANNFAIKLLPFINKPIDDLKDEVMDLIEDLPGKVIRGNKKQAISEMANKLIRRLKPNVNIEEEVVYESEFEEHLWDWLEKATFVSNEIKRKNQYLVKNFIQRILDIQSEDDSGEATKKEISEFLESLLMEDIELSARQRRDIVKNILKEINYKNISSYNLYQEGNEIPELIVDEISELVDDIPVHISLKKREKIKEDIADVIAPNVFDLDNNNDKVEREVVSILKKDAKLPPPESKNLAGEIIFKVNGMDFPLDFRRGTITETEMRNIVKEEVSVIMDDFDIPSDNKTMVEDDVTEILADQIVRDTDDATTENQIVSVLVNADIDDDDIETLTHRLMRRNREMSVCYRSPDKSFKLLMKSTIAEAFLLTPTERRIFEDKAEQEILNFVGEVTGDDSLEVRLKRRPDVVNLAAKVALLMADPNGIAREDRIMREIKEYIDMPSIETNEDRGKLAKKLRERLRNIDYTTSIQTSTPQKDRVSYFIPPRFSADTTAVELDEDEDEDNRCKKRQRSKSRTQAQLLHEEAFSYSDLLIHAIKLWMNEIGLVVNMPDEQGFKNNMCKDIASDVIDRQKYLESTVTSEKEELEHIKYQLFRWLNKIIDPEYLSEVVSTAGILMNKINAVPIPQLVDPDKFRQSISFLPMSLFKQDSSQFIAENLEGAILVWIKRQPFYQERSLEDKNYQESLVPQLAQAIKSAILQGPTTPYVDMDDVLVMEIVKQLKEFPMDFQYKTIYIHDLAKKLLNHLKNLQLFQNISLRAPMNASLAEKSITPSDERQSQDLSDSFIKDAIAEWSKSLVSKRDLYSRPVIKAKEELAEAIKVILLFSEEVSITNVKKVFEDLTAQFLDKIPLDLNKTYDVKNLSDDLLKLIKKYSKEARRALEDAQIKKASEFMASSIADWCDNLPVKAGTPEEINQIKRKIANTLTQQFDRFNNDPDIFYDDSLYDEMLDNMIEETMDSFPGLDLQIMLPLRKTLAQQAKEARLKALKEKPSLENEKRYRQELRRTIVDTLPHEIQTIGEKVPFEVLKDEVADAFINLHYVGGDQEKNILKNKIHDEINKFFNEYLSRYPSTPIDSQKLNRDLYSALKNVAVPDDDESLKKDTELGKIKIIINDWIKELPIEEQTDIEKFETSKLTSELSKKIYEIERQKDLYPVDDDYDEMMKREILKVMTNIPRLGIKKDDDLQNCAIKLIKRLNITKELRRPEASIPYTQFLPPGVPPCALTTEDQAHLQIIRERASSRLRAWGPHSAYFSTPSVDVGSQTEILCAGPGICQGPRTCHGKSTNGRLAKQSSGVQTPTQRMQAVGSQIALSPQVIIKEYYWDTFDSSLATPCASSPEPCTFTRCTMTDPILSHRSFPSAPRQFPCGSQAVSHLPARTQPAPSSCHLKCTRSVSRPMAAHRNICQQTGPYSTCQSPCTDLSDNVSQAQRSQHRLPNANPQRPCHPPSTPCSPHRAQGLSCAQLAPQTRPQHQIPCSSRRPWYASQELISSEDALPSCALRNPRVTHLGSFDRVDPASTCRDSNWGYPENDAEIWEGNRRCLISENVGDPCMIDRQRKEERERCRCKERIAPKSRGRKAARGSPRCSSPNRSPMASCSKCRGVYCPYPSYMFFR